MTVHHADYYQSPYYRIHCSNKWVETEFEKDPSPLDEVYMTVENLKFSPVEKYVTCSKCLELIREDEPSD